MNGFNRGYGGNQRRRPAQQQRAPQISEKAAQALNASPEDVRQAAQNGDLTALTSRLTPQQTQQLRQILADEAATKRLLATPQAQALLNSLRKDE